MVSAVRNRLFELQGEAAALADAGEFGGALSGVDRDHRGRRIGEREIGAGINGGAADRGGQIGERGAGEKVGGDAGAGGIRNDGGGEVVGVKGVGLGGRRWPQRRRGAEGAQRGEGEMTKD